MSAIVLALAVYPFLPTPQEQWLQIVQVAVTIVVTVLVMPGLHVLLQMFRAPSLELQKQNQSLQTKVDELTLRVSEIEGQFSDALAEVEEEGEMLYLVVHNRGRAADFYAMLRMSGVSAEPNKETYARWDSTHNSEKRQIARGVRAKLRLAKKEYEIRPISTFKWVVYGWTTFGHFERDSQSSTLILSNPPSDQWSVRLDIELIAYPDFRYGPMRFKVMLRGNADWSVSAN